MANLATLSQSQPSWALEEFVDQVNQLLPTVLPQPLRDEDPLNPRLVRYYTSEGLVDRPERQGREARYRYRHLLQVLLVRRLLKDGYGLGAIAPLLQDKSDRDLEALLQGGVQLTLEAANPALAFLKTLQSSVPMAHHDASRYLDFAASSQPRSLELPSAEPGSSGVPWPLKEPLKEPINAPTLSPPSPERFALSEPVPAQSVNVPPSPSPDSPAPSGHQPAQSVSLLAESPPAESWLHIPLLPGLVLLVRENFNPPQTPQEQQNLVQLLMNKFTLLKTASSSKRSGPGC
jgi:DNA-binding transcriptional MerR regulator